LRRARAIALAVFVVACSGGADTEGRRRLLAAGDEEAAQGPVDLDRPGAALHLDADEVARRLGSFEWTAAIEWSAAREGDDALRVRAVERHRVRQSVTGDFEVVTDVDPGLGPGSETGKQVVRAGGMTYGRAKHAPFRERPTDRGRDARLFRAESFSLPLSVARLYGDALAFAPAGETTVLGRPARRYRITLAKDASPPPTAAHPEGPPAPDADTLRRRAFLEGRIPRSADGELVLDAASGAPLRVRIAGTFGVKDEPKVRVDLELLAQIRALGGEVPAIVPPEKALPDERKTAGVAGALEAAGLRRRPGEEKPARAEPSDEQVQ
jgi:hypothetical protein